MNDEQDPEEGTFDEGSADMCPEAGPEAAPEGAPGAPDESGASTPDEARLGALEDADPADAATDESTPAEPHARHEPAEMSGEEGAPSSDGVGDDRVVVPTSLGDTEVLRDRDRPSSELFTLLELRGDVQALRSELRASLAHTPDRSLLWVFAGLWVITLFALALLASSRGIDPRPAAEAVQTLTPSPRP